MCGLRATTLIRFIYIFVILSSHPYSQEKKNTFSNKINVLLLFIRNSHLTLALKPLSNTKLLHTRKCYKNKVFTLLDKSILRNICHCQIKAFSTDCEWDSHVQQFLLTHSAHTKPFFFAIKLSKGSHSDQRRVQYPLWNWAIILQVWMTLAEAVQCYPTQIKSCFTHPEYLATTAVSPVLSYQQTGTWCTSCSPYPP